MEHQPAFSLNTALEAWLDGLRQRGTFSADDLEELRTHVLDSLDGLKETGLSEEEAFLIATRRVGDKETLGQEFEKISPGKPIQREAILFLVGAFALFLFRSVFGFMLDKGIWALRHLAGESPRLSWYYGGFALALWLAFTLLLIAIVKRVQAWQAPFFGFLHRFPFGVAVLSGVLLLALGFFGGYLSSSASFEYKDIFWSGFYLSWFLVFLYAVLRYTTGGHQSFRAQLRNAPARWLVIGGVCLYMVIAIPLTILGESYFDAYGTAADTVRKSVCLGITSFLVAIALAGSSRYSTWALLLLALAPCLVWFSISILVLLLSASGPGGLPSTANQLSVLGAATAGAITGLALGKWVNGHTIRPA